jgi:hypothetical protein
MNKKTSLIAVTSLAVIASGLFAASVYAANTKGVAKKQVAKPKVALTADQQADWQAKEKAVQDALLAGDYNAYNKAVQARNASKMMTETQFQDLAKNHKEQQVKSDAVKAALKSGNYEAWVTAEKAMNANSPMLTKITSANFAKYAQLFALREQADGLAKELGLNPGQGQGYAKGFGEDRGTGTCPMAGANGGTCPMAGAKAGNGQAGGCGMHR